MKEENVYEEELYHISADSVYSDERRKVLNYSNTFVVFDRSGNVHPHGNMVQGIYHKGTRFINQLELSLNGEQPLLLSDAVREGNSIHSADLTNPVFNQCNIAENSIHIKRNQFVREGAFYEEVKIFQYGSESCTFNLELAFNGDFRDIFEIRGIKRIVEANSPYVIDHNNYFETEYLGLDGIKRSFEVYFKADANYSLTNNKAVFTIDLKPGKPITINYCINFLIGTEKKEKLSYKKAKELTLSELNEKRILFSSIDTSNEQFNHWIFRSQTDVVSLLSQTAQGKYPYAGVPWYNTPFGRDGIITAMETLWVNPETAKDVLLFLAANQATELIPEKDSEPGKIL